MGIAIKQRILAFSLPSCHFGNKLVYFVQEVALLLLWIGIYVMSNLKYPLLVLEICGNICLFHLKALYVYSGLYSLALDGQMVVVLLVT